MPAGAAKTAKSNSGTIRPGEIQPRSPPRAADSHALTWAPRPDDTRSCVDGLETAAAMICKTKTKGPLLRERTMTADETDRRCNLAAPSTTQTSPL
eukprot:2959976-Pleurochrysis_carterae.AAC.3